MDQKEIDTLSVNHVDRHINQISGQHLKAFEESLENETPDGWTDNPIATLPGT